MQTESHFYDLVKNSDCAKMLDADTQSYLFCSRDTQALKILAKILREKDNLKDNLADVVYLPRDEKVLVSDIEQITSSAHITPLELRYKYYIIQNGQTMNDSAANKLLKTLEEPPKKIKIIIFANDEYSVLPTIRSRCRLVQVRPFGFNQLASVADIVYKNSPYLEAAKALSLGSITRLKKAISGEYLPIETVVFDTLLGMKRSSNMAQYSQMVLNHKDNLDEVIDMFELVFLDVQKIHGGISPLLSYSAHKLEQISQFYKPFTIIRLRPIFDRARERLANYGNAASVTEEFLFSLLEVRQRCQS